MNTMRTMRFLSLILVSYVYAEDVNSFWNKKLPSDDKKALTNLYNAVTKYGQKNFGPNNYKKALDAMNSQAGETKIFKTLFGDIDHRTRLMFLGQGVAKIRGATGSVAVEADRTKINADLAKLSNKIEKRFNG